MNDAELVKLKEVAEFVKARLQEQHQASLFPPEDWSVSDVDLSTTDQQVVIHVEYTGDSSVCPTCDELSPVYDQRGDIRRWRHLDTIQFETCRECDPASALSWSRGKEHRHALVREEQSVHAIV